MSAELDKITNRIRELDGRKFVKVPQALLRIEREIELLREEIAEEKQAKQTPLIIQQLESKLLAALKARQEIIRKKV